MKTSSTAATPQEYIDSLDEPRRSQIRELDAFIRKNAPSLSPFMLTGMLAYGPYHYVYESGREGDWAVVSLSARKNYISLYICATDEKGYVAEQYKKKLPKASIGKSCIRFKSPEDIDQNILKELLKTSERWLKKEADKKRKT